MDDVVTSTPALRPGLAAGGVRATLDCDDLYALPARLGARAPFLPQIAWSDSSAGGERWLALGEIDSISAPAGSGFASAYEVVARARERLKVLASLAPDPAAVRYFGGIAFDPRHGANPAWPGGEAARFVLPRVFLRQAQGRTEVTVLGTPEPEAQRILKQLREAAREPAVPATPIRVRETVPAQSRSRWTHAVQEALRAIDAGAVRKVVLARDILLDAEQPIDCWDLHRLVHEREPHGLRFCLRFDGDSAFMGASPERLVAQDGAAIACDCLAGTIERGADAQAQARNAAALLASEKDGREHRIVLEEILAAIAPHVRAVESPRRAAHPDARRGHAFVEPHPRPATPGRRPERAHRGPASHAGGGRLAAASRDGPDPRARGALARLVRGARGLDRPRRGRLRGGDPLRHRARRTHDGLRRRRRRARLRSPRRVGRDRAQGGFVHPAVRGARVTLAGGGAPGGKGTARANLLQGRALVAGLLAGGVRHLCLSPGSRSSPLAIAAHLEPRLAVTVQVDERSAAFLALGIAKATRAPVALVCTSGTAAANYLPAVAEAFLAGVPLVVLTADRPPELRGTGAAQTIDQIGLYGSHVRAFRDLPCPDDAGATAGCGCAGCARGLRDGDGRRHGTRAPERAVSRAAGARAGGHGVVRGAVVRHRGAARGRA